MEYKIDFDEEKHIYRVNGVIKPSVSQIINEVIKNGEDVPTWVKKYGIRGNYVHKVIKTAIIDKIDESSIDESAIGFYNSWKKFYEKENLKHTFVERILYNPIREYCGTIDFVGMCQLLDWKHGLIFPYFRAQLGAYFSLCKENGIDYIDRLSCIKLNKDGVIATRYDYDIGLCMSDWNSIINVFYLKQEAKSWKKPKN